MIEITPVILSGGAGSRLWPSSRSMHPKQFLKLIGDESMLQQTIGRIQGFSSVTPPIVVANDEHRFMVAEQLRQKGINAEKILLEPVGRNTAPAIALAALSVLEDEDRILLVLPADHLIKDVDIFYAALSQAAALAEQDKLVTFGIVPDSPETGYGYIKAGGQKLGQGYLIERFVEKPDKETAQMYLQQGGYFWNSGMFMFKASAYLQELEKHNPIIFGACRDALERSSIDLDFTRIDRESFELCPGDSVDYSVMEKTDNGAVVPMDPGWNDIGSWSALWDELEKDSQQNAMRGDVILKDVKNSLVVSESKLIACLGIENIVLVESDDAILLADKSQVQDIKNIVEQLKQLDRSEASLHRKVYRPWGYYDSIEVGEGFQVKRLVVKPGARLSLQSHTQRAEHWVVVNGVAEVTNGEKTFQLKRNESTYIPIGNKHQLANSGEDELEIIEVQSGSYLGEDDIERYEDVYGRVDLP